MTLPYIPGWWDEISRSATGFVSQLPQLLEPDTVANQRLQQLIQQNPMLLSQIENMTPEARMAMEQTLGFKKQTPLQKLPEGPELKRRKEDEAFLAGATPAQREMMIARRLGTKTTTELEREQQEFDQDLANGKLQNQVLLGQVKDIERVQKQIDSANARYPSLQGTNIRALVRQAVRGGQQPDPQLITAIQADPGAKQLFDIAYATELASYKSELDKQLARTKSPETQSLLLRTLAEIGNQLNDQEMRTMAELQTQMRDLEGRAANPLTGMKYIRDPNLLDREKAAVIEPYMSRLAEIRKAASENTARTTQLVTGMGLGVPAANPSATGAPTSPARTNVQAPQAPQAPAASGFNMFGGIPSGGAQAQQSDPEVQMALQAIQMRPDQEKQIRAKYKQRTGKDLP